MFLTAAPYFHRRFQSNRWLSDHFQSAVISVSTFTNLASMLALTKMQKNASYPRRISLSLFINIVCFTLLAVSTLIHTSAGVYFGFLMVMVFFASLSTGLIQNGLFSYVSGFSRSEYTQAIMTGQAVAGVLPPLAEMITVAALPSHPKPQSNPAKREEHAPDAPGMSPKSACAYFLTATVISVLAMLAFFYLLRRRELPHPSSIHDTIPKSTTNTSEASTLNNDGQAQNSAASPAEPNRPAIPLTTLFLKLPFLSTSVFLCFAVTMIFPVFAASTLPLGSIAPALFIALAFLIWNLGDLFGRLSTLYKPLNLTHYPFALFCLALSRLIFIPLYMLCNLGGHGAVVKSDVFYLVIVQFLFGLTNGYLGSECMMGAGEWVKEEEREAAGGFMGLCVVGGLTAGSLLSFFVGGL